MVGRRLPVRRLAFNSQKSKDEEAWVPYLQVTWCIALDLAWKIKKAARSSHHGRADFPSLDRTWRLAPLITSAHVRCSEEEGRLGVGILANLLAIGANLANFLRNIH